MDLEALTIGVSEQLSKYHSRGLFHPIRIFQTIVVFSCILFCRATCGPSSTNGMLKSVEHDACESFGEQYDVTEVGDICSGYGDLISHLSPGMVCTNSHSFCFPSTLRGFAYEEHGQKAAGLEVSGEQSNGPLPEESTKGNGRASNKSWSSDFGVFKLLKGGVVSCSLNSKEYVNELSSIQADDPKPNYLSSSRRSLLNQNCKSFGPEKSSEMTKGGYFDEFSSPSIEINPTIMDWGQKHLFLPSLAFLTVENTCNDSILHVYEPFSTDFQFYPCNFSEASLGPGEVASICFVYLPRSLGLSSAHLVLQTSLGGFLIQAKGFAVESPYGIQPILGLDVSSSGRWTKNFSFFNPFDEILHVEEVTGWMSISGGHTSYYTEMFCSTGNFWGSNELGLPSFKEQLVVKSGPVGSPYLAIRPHGNWELGPGSTETIVEIDFSIESEVKIFGALCMQLLRSSQDKSDTVMVPLEAELHGKTVYDDFSGSISAFLEPLVGCDSGETVVVALYIRNGASHLLNIVKIGEVSDTKKFHVKYVEGLLLFPGTVTQAALVTCLCVERDDSPPEVSSVYRGSKLFVLTNDSSTPEVHIPCKEITHFCSRHRKDSSIGYEYWSEKIESGKTRAGPLGNGIHSQSKTKALDAAESDELVLENWKSQGTLTGMSVLDDHEVAFPVVEVGSHFAKWITVKNPSQQPVIMQLILNSGEIIDECRSPDGFVQPPSSSLVHDESVPPAKYGFSISENAVTEAYVHPNGKASFGPISFQPSNRCRWRSSALVRNNLSGVEWVSLRGFGGSLSLVLLEGSEPVQNVEFNLNLPIPLNISSPNTLIRMEETIYACSQPLSKEIYAKNTGDLPLEVRKIGVSGTECRKDGFMVHTCKGFLLEPGESTKLLISYQYDFSSSMVQRDLELAMDTGILVFPIKAGLPMYMLNICQKSVFWMQVKKSSVAVLLVISLMLLVFRRLFSHVTLGSLDDLCKRERSSIATTLRRSGKSANTHQKQRNGKLSVPREVDRLPKSMGDDNASVRTSVRRYPDGQSETPEQPMTAQRVSPFMENLEEIRDSSDSQKERALASSLLSKSVAFENSDTTEASQHDNLTVITGKGEGGRRRRKRKGAGSKLTILSEVSSSQSGNSTPSSPLSPVVSVTRKRTWPASPDVEQIIEARYLNTGVADQLCRPTNEVKILEPQVTANHCNSNLLFSTEEQPSAPRKTTNKPVLLPSATFPRPGRPALDVSYPSPFLTSSSAIAPHARAPGSKLYYQKAEENAGLGDEYTYDIWGDHFSGLHLMSKNVTSMISSTTAGYSESFFVSGPQTFMTNSRAKSVSFGKDG